MSRNHLEEKKTDEDPSDHGTGFAVRNHSNTHTTGTPILELQQREDLQDFRSLVQDHPQVVENLMRPLVVEPEKDEEQRVDEPQQQQQQRQRQQQPIISWMRALMLDLPLALLFALYLAVYCIRTLHQDYYLQLFDRSTRTDKDLLEEYTYYERQCNEYDLTTHNLPDLLAEDTDSAVDLMMTHGGIVIPEIMNASTVQALRKHVVERNAAVSEQEAFPVSQGHLGLRVSYGIDATESTAVTNAIVQVVHHPLLRPLLQRLTGDVDPASAEITAITSYYGAGDQVWHADTKGDGNALKFSRTYTHSYSLFVPLQDTTEAMGATDICPGTHYCANGLEEMCEENKMGLHLANPEKQVFEAGHAALLNQHVWHRGSAHTDPNAPERVVFIMSFLARPPADTSNGDARQLSRGTYFHQRWNMWGHTYKDLLNPLKSMRQPFSVLRAMGLWKPPSYNWGYDLVTSAFLRFCNEQLEEDELYGRFLPRLDQLGFPKFLRGQVLMDASEKQSWKVFVQETIDKTFEFLQKTMVWTHGVYFAGLFLLTFLAPRGIGLSRASKRLLFTHGILLFVTWKILSSVRESQWGQDVLSKRRLMRPFPPVELARQDGPTGLTTMPHRHDVLVGTRFDAPFLGSYERWLDYHPGNVVLRQAVSERVEWHKNSPPVVADRLEQDIINLVHDREGRFLLQDYRNGDWRIMSDTEALNVVRENLLSSSNAVLESLRKAIDRMIANYRFGVLRDTLLAHTSNLFLRDLRKAIMTKAGNRPEREASISPLTAATASPRFGTFTTTTTSAITARALDNTTSSPSSTRNFSLPTSSKLDFQVGSSVWVVYGGNEWFPGSITAARLKGFFDVAFDDGTRERNVAQTRLRKHSAVTEGDRVEGCFDPGLQSCYSGTIGRVHPSGRAMIAFDDGDVEWGMTPDNYYVPPFRYAMEYYY